MLYMIVFVLKNVSVPFDYIYIYIQDLFWLDHATYANLHNVNKLYSNWSGCAPNFFDIAVKFYVCKGFRNETT